MTLTTFLIWYGLASLIVWPIICYFLLRKERKEAWIEGFGYGKLCEDTNRRISGMTKGVKYHDV